MKRKHFQLTGVFAILILLLSSCWFLGPSVKGNGNVTEEVRQVDEFDQIKVSRGMNVYITQGIPAKVVVIADNNLHEIIETKVEGGVLKVTVNENIRWAKEKKVMVTIDKLNGVEVTSGSNAWSQGPIKSDDLELKASSGANLTMEVNAKLLSADCSSGANIKLSGLAKDARMETSSGANLKGEELTADKCKMRASSGGNVSSTVTGRLEANASSGGNVVYYGDPGSTDINTSSGGNIHRK
ncbi:MAG TPA: head GIN domain-containing protein [Prolixibacteraceae bacterium]|nr:head GIN domain-containing protein [Prolixibacteraceae bacterium]